MFASNKQSFFVSNPFSIAMFTTFLFLAHTEHYQYPLQTTHTLWTIKVIYVVVSSTVWTAGRGTSDRVNDGPMRMFSRIALTLYRRSSPLSSASTTSGRLTRRSTGVVLTSRLPRRGTAKSILQSLVSSESFTQTVKQK